MASDLIVAKMTSVVGLALGPGLGLPQIARNVGGHREMICAPRNARSARGQRWSTAVLGAMSTTRFGRFQIWVGLRARGVKRWTGFAATLFAVWGAERATAAPVRPTVLLVSIDGLRPDYVLEADKYGLKIPNLRRLQAEGAFATGVRGILPTLTFPSHATLMTGASPQRHGIYGNAPFDPVGKFGLRWNWYIENFKIPTLWQAAAKAGLTTANVRWPLSVGAPITWNLPHIYFYGGAEDLKLYRLLSTPGLAATLEQETKLHRPAQSDVEWALPSPIQARFRRSLPWPWHQNHVCSS